MIDAIRNLDDLVKITLSLPKRKVVVANGHDDNTIESAALAVKEGLAEFILLGDEEKIREVCTSEGIDPGLFQIINVTDSASACTQAVSLVKSGEADVLMKGLVNTDIFLKSVLQKGSGLLPTGNIMTYTGVLDVPSYDKLLFITDPAVIPYPDLSQKKKMIEYSVKTAKKLGISLPKVSLVSCTEKVNPAIPNTVNDAVLCKMNDRGQIKDCIVDGPLDVFLSCNPEAGSIKGVDTPVKGEADILVFPSLEASNAFYKGLIRFAGAELAGIIEGTEKPVVVMSRSESAKSKYYCIALACLLSAD